MKFEPFTGKLQAVNYNGTGTVSSLNDDGILRLLLLVGESPPSLPLSPQFMFSHSTTTLWEPGLLVP